MAKYRFGDICEVLNGRAYKQNELLSSGKYPILRVGNFFSSDRWYYSDMELPENKYCDYEDLLFAWSASFGPKIWDGGKVIYHYHIWKLIPNDDVADKFYLYYWLQHSVNRLTAGTHGSVMAHMTKGDMENQSIELPSLQTQKKISSILRTIDEKIHNNEAINNNLAEQMLSLFKNQFSYVLQGSDNTLESLIDFSNGKKRPIEDGNIPVYGGNGILAYTNKSNSSNCIVIGRVGAYCGNVFLSTNDCWISDNAIQGKCKISKSQLFAYMLLKNAELPSRHIGTGQPLMTQGILNSIPCSIPPIEDILKFNEICTPLQITIENNYAENDNLSTIRDTLLPKLMSGELNVSEINI